ncbi:MAG: PH domain-containing protein [Bdellovibrionota bacterium]
MKIKTVRPSIKALLLFFIFATLPISFLYIYAIATCAVDCKIGNVQIDAVYYVLMAICVLEVIRRYFNDKYVIHSDKIISVQGIISFHLTRNTINYIDIREIKTNQTILGRLVGYGDLQISTASTSEIEITLRNIDDVNSLNQEIIRYKNALQTATSGMLYN